MKIDTTDMCSHLQHKLFDAEEALRITAGAVVTKDVPANAIDGGGLYLVTNK